MTGRIVVIGTGLAGVRAIEELIARGVDGRRVTVFGEEPYAPYDRIQLSSVLAGEKSRDEITTRDRTWFESHGIALRTGCRIAAIDREGRCVRDTHGRLTAYDTLLIATGSAAVRLPLPGADLPGVLCFRDLHDVSAMTSVASEAPRAVVIGGGLLGLEAAHGLQQRGMQVTVVHLMGHLMERQLDAAAGAYLAETLRERGVDILLNAQSKAILGEERARAVQLADGREIPTDIVVMAVGIRPRTALAADAGLAVGRGIVVDDTMRTEDPCIYALGECAEVYGQTWGLVAPLYKMAEQWADHITGKAVGPFKVGALSTRLKVAGIDVFSAGDVSDDDELDVLCLEDRTRRVYKAVRVRGSVVEGVVLYGDVRDASWYTSLVRDRTDVSEFRDDLLFGRAAASLRVGDVSGATEDVVSWADGAEVCGCNGVCKGTIVSRIRERGLTTLDEIRAHTKASASCGSCTPLVKALAESVLGGEFAEQVGDPPLCPCTPHSHDEVRAAIVERSLLTIDAVMEGLEWSTPEGCAKCRPALNYYLLVAWPDTYKDDDRSRVVNERVHANIQRDGTYSVVPRIFGGVTSSRTLRAIADVVDKFRIPTVKVTGGQRLDLLGVEKQDLPAVWEDLNAAGLVSGHAYGKAVRTVKTCVGSEWCRVGVQDSTGLGVRLEELSWGAWAPHKFKMGVSGCPRNCAEATIKDFGAVAVESGWELHIGGNGGTKVRAADFLVKVETAEEVEEYMKAFLQLYREEGRYGRERTAHWVERVGLESIRSRLVEDAQGRRELAARFDISQRSAQSDPWASEGQKASATRGYAPLTPNAVEAR